MPEARPSITAFANTTRCALGTVVRRATLVIAALALASCAQAPVAPGADPTTAPAAEAGRAFGRVLLVESGRDVEFSFLSRLMLFVQSTRTGEIQRMDFTSAGGRFSWPLPPGEYAIVSYSRLNRVGRIWTTFSVPSPKEAAYIGDLRIETSQQGYRFSIRDTFADALKDAEAGLARDGFTPVKALMRLEERVGSFRRMTSICSAEWGLECDRTNQGVKPVSPLHSVLPHPATESQTPQLVWTPVSREGVTYDVAIYESLSAPSLGLARARGGLFAYAEGLKDASFQPATPLAAGKRYDWSVRLRQGDTVSSWSTTGYFVFFVVGWAAGSGNWFGFATPGSK